MSQNIYFDESGFTGNNLLSENQKFFAYGSVATSDSEAKEIVEHILKKHKIQGGELKGKNLLKSNSGKRAVTELLELYDGRMKSVVQNKKFALGGKFFEYVFEPVLSQKISLFYHLNFHKFIANYLHIETVTNEIIAEDLFADFENFMRGKVESNSFFKINKEAQITPTFKHILGFAQNNKESVIKEFDSLEGVGLQKWILDLTDTSLFNLLAHWGTKYAQLTAICDDSKPLKSNLSNYEAMIGRTKKEFQIINGNKLPITFNLSGPVNLADSRSHHGVQIADVVAATTVYVSQMNDVNDAFLERWQDYFYKNVIYSHASVVPEVEHVELERNEVRLNDLLLEELFDRSKNKTPLLQDIEEFLQLVNHALRFVPAIQV